MKLQSGFSGDDPEKLRTMIERTEPNAANADGGPAYVEHEILLQAERWRRAGVGVAIATVIETFGSAPRPAGSHLVVDGEGRFLGSVSAGCVEADVIEAAIEAIGDGVARTLEFGVADETVWRPGLSCGGRMVVLVEQLDDERSHLLYASNRLSASRRPHGVATPLEAGCAPSLLIEGDPLLNLADASRTITCDGRRWFIERRDPAPRLIVVGAVHVAQALASMAHIAGFDVIVLDPRTAYLTPERFPGLRLDARWPEQALPDIGLNSSTAIATLSHDPKIDDPALRLSLASDCFYIGALGSEATHARRVARLAAAGLESRDIERVHAPIGLDIGALSPTEIAAAVLGEMILARRRKPLRRARRENTA